MSAEGNRLKHIGAMRWYLRHEPRVLKDMRRMAIEERRIEAQLTEEVKMGILGKIISILIPEFDQVEKRELEAFVMAPYDTDTLGEYDSMNALTLQPSDRHDQPGVLLTYYNIHWCKELSKPYDMRRFPRGTPIPDSQLKINVVGTCLAEHDLIYARAWIAPDKSRIELLNAQRAKKIPDEVFGGTKIQSDIATITLNGKRDEMVLKADKGSLTRIAMELTDEQYSKNTPRYTLKDEVGILDQLWHRVALFRPIGSK